MGRAKSSPRAVLPYVEEVEYIAPEAALRTFAGEKSLLLMDSPLRHDPLGRYSFLTCDPFERIEFAKGETSVFSRLREAMATWKAEPVPGLPPFQGGLAGLFAYDLNRSIERISPPRFEDSDFPAVAVAIYDTVLAWDHSEKKCWIISQGFPETDPALRAKRAENRCHYFRERLSHVGNGFSDSNNSCSISTQNTSSNVIGPIFPVELEADLWSSFSKPDYLKTVQRAIEYIRAGDIFQVNLSHRLMTHAKCPPIELYCRLSERNKATFAAYFDWEKFQIISASPERLIQVHNGKVETRPIKGTTRRMRLPMADLYSAQHLQSSEKDRAENVMIVDLLRNDLSRVCSADSVQVTQLFGIESYEFVQHLVSAVEGQLEFPNDVFDLLEAVFPGGSITGAPKVRAMEIIAELEPTCRNAYCGSLGYIGFDRTVDLNILIRTITARGGWWEFPVGGGIVSQSEPEREWEETGHKARGLLRAIR